MSEPERIDEAVLGWHRHLAERARRAAVARQEIAKTDGACQAWIEHLRIEYKLEPGDHVDDDGLIVRGDGS